MQNKLGGPRTEQGKARSSQNATKHGLTSAKMFVLQNENPEAWQDMLRACQEEFQPANDFERKLVEEIAFAKWRLRRAWTVETALWDHEMDEQAEAFAQKYEAADEGTRQALAFKSLADSKALSLLIRYESRLKRDYRNAIKVLEERRAARAEQPVEECPAAETQAETKDAPATHEHSTQPAASVRNEPAPQSPEPLPQSIATSQTPSRDIHLIVDEKLPLMLRT